MLMFKQKIEDKGWLTFAQNSNTVNYVIQAYLLALSIKATCKHNRFAIVVDEESEKTISKRQRQVFDHVIVIPHMEPFHNEAYALDVTPFKETFKVESDMIIPRNIDHWWNGCRIQDVCYTSKVRDYQGRVEIYLQQETIGNFSMPITLQMLIMALHILGTVGLVLSFLIMLRMSSVTGILCITGFLIIVSTINLTLMSYMAWLNLLQELPVLTN